MFLAVGRAAAEPAAVHLGQLEGRRTPCSLVQRRLHVVVRVEQHGGRGRIRAGPRPDHGLAAVSGLLQVRVLEADLGELVEHPLSGALALLRWNCRGSATDRMATSSASSSRTCGMAR